MEEEWLSQRSARENIFPMDPVHGEHLSISWDGTLSPMLPRIYCYLSPKPRNRDMTLINY